MKAPSGDLLFYAAMLLGGAVYLTIRLTTHAAEYQAASVALAACAAVEAVLLLVRFRWSPELYAVIILFFLGRAVVLGATDGFTGNRVGMIAGGIVALFGYPVLRGEVRGRVTPGPEPSPAADPARDVDSPDA
jgi:hypothetical protein